MQFGSVQSRLAGGHLTAREPMVGRGSYGHGGVHVAQHTPLDRLCHLTVHLPTPWMFYAVAGNTCPRNSMPSCSRLGLPVGEMLRKKKKKKKKNPSLHPCHAMQISIIHVKCQGPAKFPAQSSPPFSPAPQSRFSYRLRRFFHGPNSTARFDAL
ncbi:hypothetical protein BKA81DRAFT_110395 [Phyllosticta paracitricarpa]